jgi:hypothetical protein
MLNKYLSTNWRSVIHGLKYRFYQVAISTFLNKLEWQIKPHLERPVMLKTPTQIPDNINAAHSGGVECQARRLDNIPCLRSPDGHVARKPSIHGIIFCVDIAQIHHNRVGHTVGDLL